MAYKQATKELAGDEWNLGKLAGLSTNDFWTWSKTDTLGYDVHVYLAMDKCVNFRGIYGPSWGNACGESTGASIGTT